MEQKATGAAVTATRFTQPAKIQVRVAANTNLAQLQEIIASIGGRYGCTTCGLGGIDLRLSADPVELEHLAHLPGVQSVSIG